MKELRSDIKLLIYLALTVIFIVLIAFLIKGTVYSMESDASSCRILDGYTREAENEYSAGVRRILDEEGYRNAGIMLSVIVPSCGSREYSLNINHRKFAEESEKSLTKKEEVKQKIEALKMPTDNASVNISFTY
ncbi:MAG: hypothetical protein K5888_02080 [Lachnospiraceae bacterium]|nr:hypothetical protein [Lachnospiraceae bacterium]